MQRLSRRIFLATTAVALAAGESPLYAYAAESSSPLEKSGPLILGLLMVHDPERHFAAIQDLRRRTRFKRKFHWHGTDVYKIGYARELMRYFVHQPDMRFISRIVKPARPSALLSEQARADEYVRLFSNARLPAGIILRMKEPSASWSSTRTEWSGPAVFRVRADALVKAGKIGQAEIARPVSDGVVDIAALLNGARYGAWRLLRQADYSVSKAELVAHLERLLQVPSLAHKVAGKWEVQDDPPGARTV